MNTDKKKLFFFFIDGLGLGKDNNDNPVSDLFKLSLGGNSLTEITAPVYFEKGIIVPVDAVQGIPGIPQSATGQTSLYTGVNAQKILGYHLTAIPNRKLMRIIRERSLLKILKNRGITTTSANMYSEEFFIRRAMIKKNMFPVSTLSIKAADIPFRMINDYSDKKALFADITNKFINERGFLIDLITPEEGAERIFNILKDNQAVFFEYFMTDIYGHKRKRDRMETIKAELSIFLESFLKIIDDKPEISVLITSDHGNAEDFSTGSHTLNKVPFIFFSHDKEAVSRAEKCSRLKDIYYFVLDYFGINF